MWLGNCGHLFWVWPARSRGWLFFHSIVTGRCPINMCSYLKFHSWRGKEATFENIMQQFKASCEFFFLMEGLSPNNPRVVPSRSPQWSPHDHWGWGGRWSATGQTHCSLLSSPLQWTPTFITLYPASPPTLCSGLCWPLIQLPVPQRLLVSKATEIPFAINLDFELEWIKLKKNNIRTPHLFFLEEDCLWDQTFLENTTLPCQRLGIHISWHFAEAF